MLNWWQEWLHHAPQGDHSFIMEERATISDVLIMVNHCLVFFGWVLLQLLVRCFISTARLGVKMYVCTPPALGSLRAFPRYTS